MKSKNKTYVLLIAVLCVWGIIGYKIVNGLSPDAPVAIHDDLHVSFTPRKEIAKDTFSIQTVDRDPFLGSLTTKRKSNTTSSASKKNLPEVNMPNITYGGMVKKQQSSQQVFVVNINNKQYLLKKGQEVEAVKLIKGNVKEIVVRFNKKTLTIPLQ